MSDRKRRMQLVEWHYFNQGIHQGLGPLFHTWCSY